MEFVKFNITSRPADPPKGSVRFYVNSETNNLMMLKDGKHTIVEKNVLL